MAPAMPLSSVVLGCIVEEASLNLWHLAVLYWSITDKAEAMLLHWYAQLEVHEVG